MTKTLEQLLKAHGGQVNGVEDAYTACVLTSTDGMRGFLAALNVDAELAWDDEPGCLDVNVYAMPGELVAS